jgi:hypothetical protein
MDEEKKRLAIRGRPSACRLRLGCVSSLAAAAAAAARCVCNRVVMMMVRVMVLVMVMAGEWVDGQWEGGGRRVAPLSLLPRPSACPLPSTYTLRCIDRQGRRD